MSASLPNGPSRTDGRLIVVLLGTDHHPFARLVRWADSWAHDHPQDRVIVQHGFSPAPAAAEGVAFFSPDDLARLLGSADVVVTHGGPGTMADARAAGHVPVVVPRDPVLGEHVDGHQQRFGRWLSANVLATVVGDEPSFRASVETARRVPAIMDSRVAETASRVGGLIEELLAPRRRNASRTGPVVYIAGSGRSGSTLLERVLGQIPGVVALGEVHHLWQRGIVKNELCGCGSSFDACPFWLEVGGKAFGGWRSEDVARVAAMADAVDRHRRVVTNLAAGHGSRRHSTALEYASFYRRIYDAARAVAGASIVVDSGKHPTLALCLAQDPDIDLRVLHLVRNPVGVAYSWSKSVRRPEARADEDAFMTRYSPILSGALWSVTTAEAELLRSTRVPIARVRYEDFVTAPREVVTAAWHRLGLPPTGLHSISTHMSLGVNHTVAGNPMRFRTGEIELRADEQWRESMARRDRVAVAAVTAPVWAALKLTHA